MWSTPSSLLDTMMATEAEQIETGIEVQNEIPLAIAIEGIINTVLHLVVILIIWTTPLSFSVVKKSFLSMISLPNLLGFVFWFMDNNKTSRIVYLVSIYVTYLGYIITSVVKFLTDIMLYFTSGLSSESDDLYSVGTFFVVYGLIELFFVMGFEDYNYL